MKKIFSLLALLFLISMPFAVQTFTSNVDDYTNSKGGTASKTYNFTLDGGSKNAVGKTSNTTDMTWEQWLNITADGFNDLGLGIVNGSGYTAKGTTTYTIKYNSNGGTSFNDDLVPSGTAVTLPTPTKTGYTFGGWYTDSSFSSKAGNAGASYTTTASRTLYAKWTAITYTVSYNGNGNTSGSTANSTHTYDVAKNLTANGFTRTYTVTYNYNGSGASNTTANVSYTFAGWATSSTGSKVYNNSQSVTNLSSTQGATVPLYAKWTSASTKLPTPTRTGYTFGGWYKEAACTNKVADGGASYTPTANITLYAKWTANTYTVSYNGNGNTSGSTAKSTHTYDVAKNLTANGFKKTGYTFAGWNTAANGSGTAYANSASVKNLASANGATVTLYAQWSLDTYTISYNLNGGSVSTANPTRYNVTSADITLNNPTRVGYTFAGWTGSNGSTAQTTVRIVKGSTGNKSYVANWTPNNNTAYKVRHWQQTVSGGNDQNSTNYTLKDTDELTGTTAASVTPSVKTYTGFTSPSTKTATIAADGSTVVNYYYTRKSYTFTLGSATGVTTTGSSATGSFRYGATVTLKATASKGYTWSKWTSNNTSLVANTTTANTTFTMPAGAITMTPSVTANKYTVTFNANGGSTSTASKEVTYDSTYGKLPTPTRTGYTFNGWFTAASGGTKVESNTKVTTASAHTLYAQWTANKYVVTFIANGGTTPNPAKKDVTYDSTYGTLATTSRTGYKFAGWYTAASGGSKIESTTKVAVTSNPTLYAHWTPINYTITWNLNGGSLSGQKTSYNIETANYTLPTPTRTGYTFGGWYTSSDFSGTAVTQIAQGSTGNKTFYAKWVANSYSITYALNGGTAGTNAPTIGTFDKTVTISNPTKSGYTFTGWTFNGNTSTAKHGSSSSAVTTAWNSRTAKTTDQYFENLTATSGESVTLTAHFEKTVTGTFKYYNNQTTTVSCTMYDSATNCTITAPAALGTPSGYTFRGWSTSDAANASIGLNASAKVSLSNNATYYGSYSQSVTATFYYSTLASSDYTYSNGGQASATASATKYQNYTGNIVHSNYTIPAAVTGSTGGASAQNYAGVSKDVNSATTITPTTAYTKYYAVYNEDLTFYYYNESAHTSTKLVRRMLSNGTSYSNSLSGTVPSPSTYDGASFRWWAYDSTSDSSYRREPLQTGTNSLYAIYSKNYTVSYNANNGTGAPASQTATKYYASKSGGINVESAKLTITSSKPTRTGYIFDSWNTAANGTGTKYTSGTEYTIDSNLTLYAQWPAIKYSVKYNGNGSTSGTMANSEHTYDIAKNLTVNAYVKTGYTFAGWAKTSTGNAEYANGASVINLSSTNGATVNLYAKWTANTYKVTFNPNKGTTPTASKNVTYDSTYGTLPTPTRAGYTFDGWFTAASGGTKVESTTTVEITSDQTLYAHWTANTNTPYVVKHYLRNIDMSTYTLEDTENKTGTTDTSVTPAVKTYTGFTSPATKTANINGDGSTVIEYYYERNKIYLDLNGYLDGASSGGISGYGTADVYINGSISGNDVADFYQQIPYGSTYEIKDIKATTGHTYDGVKSGSLTGTIGTSQATVVLTFTSNVYNITYILNNGTHGASHPSTATYNTAFTVNNPTRTGYTFTGWNITGMDNVTHIYGGSSTKDTSISGTKETSFKNLHSTKGATVTFTATWTPNTDTKYVVRHYLQNLDDNNYTLKESVDHAGTSDASLTVANLKKDYTGFTYEKGKLGKTAVTTTTIAPDGSRVIDLYYTRNTYKITLTAGTGISAVTGSGTAYKYGKTVNINATVKAGYTWKNWTGTTTYTNQSVNIRVPANDITLTANATANTNTKYTVKHWKQNLGAGSTENDTNFTLANTDNLTGTTDTKVTPARKTYPGFTAPAGQTVNIDGNGLRIVNYYYTRNSYTYTLGSASGIVTTGSTASGTYQYGTSITAKATLTAGYLWGGWTSNSTSLLQNSNNQSYTFNMPAGNITLTPKTTASSYTITYNLDGGTLASQPASYTIESSTITINNPYKSSNSFLGWTEVIKPTIWYSGFVNKDTGALEKSDSYPNSVYSEPIFLKSGIKYTLNSALEGVRWRAYDTNKTTYRGSVAEGTTYTPNQDMYVRILFYLGATDAQKTAMTLTANSLKNVTIPKGSTGNRTYTANWQGVTVPTAKTLTFNNANQELVNAGSGTNVTIEYSVGTSSAAGTYSTAVPTRKDAGTYYVWYKITDQSSNQVIANDKVTVTIQRYDISNSTISGISNHKFIGSYANYAPTVEALSTTLVNNTDYTYSWANVEPSKNPRYQSTQTLTVTGKGNYTGTKTATYVETRSTDYEFTVTNTLDGVAVENVLTAGIGQFQVVVNNDTGHALSKNNIGAYAEAIPFGVSWKVTNAQAKQGYTYTGNTEYIDNMANENKTIILTWKANELEWKDQVFDLPYSTESQTVTLQAPTNGTSSGVTYNSIKTGPLSVSADGKLKVDAGTVAGKYQIDVTAIDKHSHKTKTKTMTVYVKPTLTDNVVNVSYGEKKFNIDMNGLSTSVNKATSSYGVLTIHTDLGLCQMILNTAFTNTTNIGFKLMIVDKEFDYTLRLEKTPKVLKINDAFTVFNNANQKPIFYNSNDACEGVGESLSDCIDAYKDQNSLFTWEISGNGLTNSQTARNVYYGTYHDQETGETGTRIERYTLKVKVIDNPDAPIAIFDSENPGGLHEKTIYFTIEPFKINETNTRIVFGNQTYNAIKEPEVYTTINGVEIKLVKDQDYIIKTPLNQKMNVGQYSLKITGINNYSGSISQDFEVLPKNISNLTYEEIRDYYWTGSYITPGVTIKYNGMTLVSNIDYTASYVNNINIADKNSANAPTVVITGKGNYTGTKELKFSIIPNNFDQYVQITNGQATYTGTATNGGAKVTVSNALYPHTNFEIKYGTTLGTYNLSSIPTYTNVGEYIVYFNITGNGYNEYRGSLSIKINAANNSLEIKNSDNKVVNSAKLIVPTSQTFKFTTKFNTTVSASSTEFVNVTIDNNAKTITLTPIKAGTGDIKFTAAALGNNVNSASATLSVKVLNGVITDNTTNVEGTYNGNPYTLNANYTPADATVRYTTSNSAMASSNSAINAGKYVVNYEISKTGYDTVYGSKTITINPKTIGDSWITLEYNTHEYTGQALKPKVTVKDGTKTLEKGTDYTVSYINNILPTNSANVTITGINNYQGTINKVFTITAKDMEVITHSYSTDYTSFETNGSKEQREKAVEVRIAGNYNVTYCTTDLDSEQHKGDCSEPDNYSVSIPKFKNVGIHNVKVKVVATGYKAVMTEFNITINKKLLPVPQVSQPDGYLYTGKIQEPSWIGYNSNFASKEGTSKATQPGTYQEVFKLKDPVNTAWKLENGAETVENQAISWKIIMMSIKDHETVINDYIKYNEWKQLEVQDGKTSFERTGYTQTAWVEECKDVAGSGVEERVCNYNKLIPLVDAGITTQQQCESNGEKWENNKCYHVNLFDVGSSISGMYVEKTTNPTSSLVDKTPESGYDDEKNDAYDLFAVWSKITYRIQYELCDGLGCGMFNNSITTIVSYDQEFTVPNPTRIGYIFAGWTITEMDDTPHVINGITTNDVEYTVPKDWVQHGTPSYKNLTSQENATVTMTANWDPIEYTLIYDGNKSTYRENAYTTLANAPVTTATLTGTMSNQHMSYDNPVEIPPNNYQMVGYTFNGWSTSPNGKDSSGAACTVYKHDLKDPYEYVRNDNSRCLTFTNDFMAQTNGKNLIQNLTIKDQDVIVMYAQWKQNTNTEFTVTYWQQKIGVGNAYNSTNYDLVGVERYTGLTDGMVTVTPYWYGNNQIPDGKSTSALSGTKLNNSSPSDTAAKYKVAPAEKTGDNNIDTFGIVGTSKFNNNTFRGFTLQYPQTVESPTSNSQITDGNHTKKAGTYTYVIKPDGSTNINVYYIRNTYNVTINTRQISSIDNDGNPNSRQYQISMVLQNPLNTNTINNSLVNNGYEKFKDAGSTSGNGIAGTNNSGLANFQEWYYNNSLTNQITYIDGEVSRPETIWAKWYQYRYTSSGSGAWNNWGKMDE